MPSGGVVVFDCGSVMFDSLIDRLNELKIPCTPRRLTGIVKAIKYHAPHVRTMAEILDLSPAAIIFSGSIRYNPNLKGAPFPPAGFWEWVNDKHIPVLGICYGMQMIGKALGGSIEKMPVSPVDDQPLEFHPTLETLGNYPLFKGISTPFSIYCWHKNWVATPPPGYLILGQSVQKNHVICQNIAIGPEKTSSANVIYGIQFHPEHPLTDFTASTQIFNNFWALTQI